MKGFCDRNYVVTFFEQKNVNFISGVILQRTEQGKQHFNFTRIGEHLFITDVYGDPPERDAVHEYIKNRILRRKQE